MLARFFLNPHSSNFPIAARCSSPSMFQFPHSNVPISLCIRTNCAGFCGRIRTVPFPCKSRKGGPSGVRKISRTVTLLTHVLSARQKVVVWSSRVSPSHCCDSSNDTRGEWLSLDLCLTLQGHCSGSLDHTLDHCAGCPLPLLDSLAVMQARHARMPLVIGASLALV